jgi:hypothetical protein
VYFARGVFFFARFFNRGAGGGSSAFFSFGGGGSSAGFFFAPFAGGSSAFNSFTGGGVVDLPPSASAAAVTTVTSTLTVSGLTSATFDYIAQRSVAAMLAGQYRVTADQVSISNVVFSADGEGRRLQPSRPAVQPYPGQITGGASFDVQVRTSVAGAAAVQATMASASRAQLTTAVAGGMRVLGRMGVCRMPRTSSA